MNKLYLIITIVLFTTCSINKPTVIMSGIDRAKYPGDPKIQVVEKYYDYLSEKYMPKILLNYYSSLKPECFRKIELIVDTTITSLYYYPVKAMSFSKKAKDGYLQINKHINDSLSLQKPFEYVINTGAVNSEKMINKLLVLKKSEIESIIMADEKFIIIKTK